MTKIDYSQLSDFEINKRVSVAAGLNVNMFFDVDEAYARGPVWTAPSGNCYAGIKSSKGNPFDPCNDPADAWPIIVEHRISIDCIHDQGKKWLAFSGDDCEYRSTHKNPLRAAMIVFLEMQ
ncbi:Nix [Enterobacter phage Mulvp2]|nr:Nix [Enterobacter phage Mulvp2]